MRQGFVQNQHLVIYLEKAYDTTWKCGIMKDPQEIGLRCRLRLVIDNLLKWRKFKTRLHNTQSSPNSQEEGANSS